MKFKKYFILMLPLLAMTVSCSTKKPEKEKNHSAKNPDASTRVELSNEQIRQAGIKTGALKDTLIEEGIEANGMIDVPPQNFATVSAPMGGYVLSTKVLPGMEVKKGQLLAVLQHQDYIQLQQDYLQAVSKLEYNKQEYDRQSELFKENASSSKKLQVSTAELKSSEAGVNALEEKLKLLGIDPSSVKNGNITSSIYLKSPIQGNVKTAHATLGKFVNPSDIMYEIIDNSHQHLELRVYEKDILKVKEGQPIIFTVPTIGAQKFQGEVYLIGKSIDPTSRAINIHGHLEKEDKERLLPGMYVNAFIVTAERKASILPQEAVILEKQSYYVFKRIIQGKEAATFLKMKIATGATKDTWIEVSNKSIITLDSNIVLQGAYSINAMLTNQEEVE